MAGQAVHLADVAALVYRLGEQVVRGEVIAAVHQRAVQLALLAGHAMERVDVGAHRHHRRQLGIGVDQQLGPGAVHRHRLDFMAVAREPPVLHQPARREPLHRAPVGRAIERLRQVEVAGIHAQRGTGDRHPLGVAGQLELRRRGAQFLEYQLAVAEDRDLAVGNAAMHPPGHLQDLVGAEVEPVQHVAAAIHLVGVARIEDDHGVEPAHVERRLARGRHGQQERSLHLALEERPDDPDRLATVIERRRQLRPLAPDVGREMLHLGAGRHEHRHAAPVADQPLHVLLGEELLRRLRDRPRPWRGARDRMPASPARRPSRGSARSRRDRRWR